MKLLIAIILSLFFGSINSAAQGNDSVTQYRENINTGVTISFFHPKTTVAVSEENSRCIEDKNNKTKLNWCIWLSDSSEISIEQSILNEKLSFKGQALVFKDFISIDSTNCVRLIIKSKLKTDPYKEIIFYIKQGVGLEIINSSGQDNRFDKFCSTIKIRKTEKNTNH